MSEFAVQYRSRESNNQWTTVSVIHSTLEKAQIKKREFEQRSGSSECRVVQIITVLVNNNAEIDFCNKQRILTL